ncbi:MAG: hypothetical protein IPJ00_08525 [Saprospirales bacterium]|nr:hypothetical protein [Saprospirales bacterium]
MRFFWTCLILMLFSLNVSAQPGAKEFPEDPKEFLAQFEAFVTANKIADIQKIYGEFAALVKLGSVSPQDLVEIRKTANQMLVQDLTASPYFAEYLTGLVQLRKRESAGPLFAEWHELLNGMLASSNFKANSFNEFLKFSGGFFELKAIRKSNSGVNWFTSSEQYRWELREGQPILIFDKLDLFGVRKQDSIAIYQTAGEFSPVENRWHGSGGKVSWERLGLNPEVYVVLGNYRIDAEKSIYEADTVNLHYPLYFGQRLIPGRFEDKLTAENPATGGSYPRFESYENILRVDNLGQGIRYTGGFRLQGTTVYGFGNREFPAQIEILGPDKTRRLRANAELFTIRREERITGESVSATIYFGADSLFHPSVNFRFEIQKRELELTRGDRGSDRNPFYSSLHNLNIDSDKINYYVQGDSITFGEKSLVFSRRKTPVVFESLSYFQESDYNRFQNIATFNPIAVIKAVSEKEGTRFLDADFLASKLDSRFTVENIQTLLYDLVAKGFISYDVEKQEVEVKDKIFHYANASQKKVDFDAMRLESETDQTNATFNINDQRIVVNGVSSVVFSQTQAVALNPFSGQIVIGKNRDMDFDGRLFAGFGTLTGKDYHLDYDKFQVRLDSVRYFDLFLPSGEKDAQGKPIAFSLGSRIEHLRGILLIDAPSNKSGRDNIPIFPSLQSKDHSYVYYDNPEIRKGVYLRDSFYFRLNPFSFNSLDQFEKDAIRFKGTMFSSDIFPDFEETLVLQDEDSSLGFLSPTPQGGYPCYRKKGQFEGNILLSNKGFLGQGKLDYLGATVNSDDIVFEPKRMTASAKRFDLREDRAGPVKVPKAVGFDVKIDWQPYLDSMYVTSVEAPFDIFNESKHFLKGTLILTPGGLKARGQFSWDNATMSSGLFSFGAYSVSADTTDLQIKSFDARSLALKTSNIKGSIDFETQKGSFRANQPENHRTFFPGNQYLTSMDQFDWDMKNEKITFRPIYQPLASFVSTHPDKDSLRFKGDAAEFDLKSNNLRITGVESIVSADAYIYTEKGEVFINSNGEMKTLENVRIVADTINKFHVINRATADIRGKRNFTAKGYYEYNIGRRQQEILFNNIVGQPIGKGNFSERPAVTRATGDVKPEDRFYIDEKTEFRGTISLFSESRNLLFNGFARLDANLTARHWFSVDFEGDKTDLAIRFDEPRNYEGEPLKTGFFLSKESFFCYPRVMAPLYFRKDRPILPIKGLFQYDPKEDKFIFGDSLKVTAEGLKGNLMTYYNTTGKVEGEGRFDIGGSLKYISVAAAGRVESTVDSALDSLAGGPLGPKLKGDFMLGVNLILPDALTKFMLNDIKASSFEAPTVIYANDPFFYKKGLSELFPEDKDMQRSIDLVSLNEFDLPKKLNNYTFLFSRVPMQWNQEYQSFVSMQQKLPVASINGDMINRMFTCYIEVRMPYDDDDRFYLFIQSPSGISYFFGFKQGILNVTSSSAEFNDLVLNLKDKERVYKMPDGATYEIQPVEQGTATSFVSRVQEAWK